MKSKKKKIILIVVVLVVAAIITLAVWPQNKEAVFNTQVADSGSVELSVTATGTIEPVDKIEVGTQVSGIVEKIYVDFNSHVTQGQLLAELDKSTLKERLSQCESQITSAKSALKYATQTYERTKELYQNKAATQVEYESAENQLVQAKTSLSNAEISYREAKVNLSYAELYAPIDGVVLSKDIEEGQTVAASFSTPTLFIIAKDLKNMQVEADVDEADIGRVKLGQKVTFTVDAYNGEIFQGKVQEIRLQPTTTNNVVTYTVIVQAPNPEEKLFPGMTASIAIVTSSQTGILVPLEAMNFSPDEELMNYMEKPERPEEGRQPQGKGPQPQDNNPGEINQSSDSIKTIWIKNGNTIHPMPVKAGLDDGVNAVVTNMGPKKGDTIVLSATLQKKVQQKAGTDLFGPKPNKNNKNRPGPGGPM